MFRQPHKNVSLGEEVGIKDAHLGVKVKRVDLMNSQRVKDMCID